MAKSNTDQGQVGEIYTPPHCSMGIILWDTIMPRALNEFIKQEDISSKLELQIKENTALNKVNPALNKVHKFLAGVNIDESF